jgi:hypothetical protein
MSDTSPPCPVSTDQIADLLAWARTLTHAGTNADPAQRAAYLAAKAGLLARIAEEHTATAHPSHDKETR